MLYFTVTIIHWSVLGLMCLVVLLAHFGELTYKFLNDIDGLTKVGKHYDEFKIYDPFDDDISISKNADVSYGLILKTLILMFLGMLWPLFDVILFICMIVFILVYIREIVRERKETTKEELPIMTEEEIFEHNVNAPTYIVAIPGPDEMEEYYTNFEEAGNNNKKLRKLIV